MRRQIFRQMKQKAEWILDVFTSIFVKYDRKFASRWRAKSPDALCAVLLYGKHISKKPCPVKTGQGSRLFKTTHFQRAVTLLSLMRTPHLHLLWKPVQHSHSEGNFSICRRTGFQHSPLSVPAGSPATSFRKSAEICRRNMPTRFVFVFSNHIIPVFTKKIKPFWNFFLEFFCVVNRCDPLDEKMPEIRYNVLWNSLKWSVAEWKRIS